MTAFNTDLYNSQVGTAGQTPSFGRMGAKWVAGKLRKAIIPYVCDGAETNGDTINLCKLKEGALVLTQECKVSSQAAFDVNDMNVGVSGNDNKYADAIDTLNAASDVAFTGGDNHYLPVEVAEGGETVIATCVAVTTTTAGQLALFLIGFVDE